MICVSYCCTNKLHEQRFVFAFLPKTALPTKPSQLEPRQINVDQVYTHKRALRERQKSTFNSHAKALPSLGVGDTVRIEPTSVKKGQAWESGIVEQQVGERSYNVRTPSGIIKNRNRAQLRKINKTTCAAPRLSTSAVM